VKYIYIFYEKRSVEAPSRWRFVTLSFIEELWNWCYGSEARRTSNHEPALHLVLPEVIDGPAAVSAPVKRARLADVQSQHALVVPTQKPGVFTDDHAVLHPNDLWLRNRVLEEEEEEEEAHLAG